MVRTLRGALAAVLAIALAVSLVGVALADHSVQMSDDGNDLRVFLDKNGNDFTCRATNFHANGNPVDLIVVSSVCQYRMNGTWHDFETAPGDSKENADQVSETYGDNPCTNNDGGANLPNGQWAIRSQGDGRWFHNDVNHPFNADGGALETTHPFFEANC